MRIHFRGPVSRCLTLTLSLLLYACSSDQATVVPNGTNSENGGATAGTDAGGTTGTSSASSVRTGGTSSAGGANGGSPSTGGMLPTGGRTSGTPTGGTRSTGGAVATGGAQTAGGMVATGGTKSSGGNVSSGGTTNSTGGTKAATGGMLGTGGTPATGGMPATGGARPTGGMAATGGTPAATSCSFPSGWAPGSATYTTYTLPNAQTACGYNGSNNTIKNIPVGANFAAIPGNTSSDFNTSNRCGACVQIGSATITIVDECPNDSNAPCKANSSGHLDLSQAAANAGGVKGDPALTGQNPWKFIPCPVTGNVIVRLKNGNNNEFYVENEILPIQSVTCNGSAGSRQSYGAWHFSASSVAGQSCTATDIANRSISFTVGSTQGQDVDTGKQFPKCN
jgi:hypothetical protein